MDDEKVLSLLQEKISDVKSQISTKEGERKVFLSRLKKEFEITNIEDAYTRLKEISAEREVKEERRHSLLAKAQERLADYGG